MAREVIPFPPRSSPPLPSPFASPLQGPGPQLFAERSEVCVCVSRRSTLINMATSSSDEIDIEWWSESSLSISIDTSRDLYFNMVSKVKSAVLKVTPYAVN